MCELIGARIEIVIAQGLAAAFERRPEGMLLSLSFEELVEKTGTGSLEG
jgi:hypothetical protein